MNKKLDVTPNEIEFSAIEIEQPIGTFYIGAIECKDLVQIAKADMRRMEENELDNFIGIQRRLSDGRVRDLKKYVHNVDATFPTSVILAIKEENAEWDSSKGKMLLKATDKTPMEDVAVIIDGQHRVEGLKGYNGETPFQINVCVFVGIPVATQANIFATVNLAQTKVNKSLVYDLYDYEKLRSPQKSAHHITVSLDRVEKSPLYRRIKRLGVATHGRDNEQLTQATVVECLLPYLSLDPSQDRNTYKLGLIPNLYNEQELQKVIFGNLHIKKHDEKIAEILVNYFQAVAERWPNSWNDFETKGNILPKSNGFIALMGVLRPIYKAVMAENKSDYTPSKSDFLELFNKVNSLQDNKIDTEIFKPGTSGSSLMKKMILNDIFGEEYERNISFEENLV